MRFTMLNNHPRTGFYTIIMIMFLVTTFVFATNPVKFNGSSVVRALDNENTTHFTSGTISCPTTNEACALTKLTTYFLSDEEPISYKMSSSSKITWFIRRGSDGEIAWAGNIIMSAVDNWTGKFPPIQLTTADFVPLHPEKYDTSYYTQFMFQLGDSSFSFYSPYLLQLQFDTLSVTSSQIGSVTAENVFELYQNYKRHTPYPIPSIFDIIPETMFPSYAVAPSIKLPSYGSDIKSHAINAEMITSSPIVSAETQPATTTATTPEAEENDGLFRFFLTSSTYPSTAKPYLRYRNYSPDLLLSQFGKPIISHTTIYKYRIFQEGISNGVWRFVQKDQSKSKGPAYPSELDQHSCLINHNIPVSVTIEDFGTTLVTTTPVPLPSSIEPSILAISCYDIFLQFDTPELTSRKPFNNVYIAQETISQLKKFPDPDREVITYGMIFKLQFFTGLTPKLIYSTSSTRSLYNIYKNPSKEQSDTNYQHALRSDEVLYTPLHHWDIIYGIDDIAKESNTVKAQLESQMLFSVALLDMVDFQTQCEKQESWYYDDKNTPGVPNRSPKSQESSFNAIFSGLDTNVGIVQLTSKISGQRVVLNMTDIADLPKIDFIDPFLVEFGFYMFPSTALKGLPISRLASSFSAAFTPRFSISYGEYIWRNARENELNKNIKTLYFESTLYSLTRLQNQKVTIPFLIQPIISDPSTFSRNTNGDNYNIPDNVPQFIGNFGLLSILPTSTTKTEVNELNYITPQDFFSLPLQLHFSRDDTSFQKYRQDTTEYTLARFHSHFNSVYFTGDVTTCTGASEIDRKPVDITVQLISPGPFYNAALKETISHPQGIQITSKTPLIDGLYVSCPDATAVRSKEMQHQDFPLDYFTMSFNNGPNTATTFTHGATIGYLPRWTPGLFHTPKSIDAMQFNTYGMNEPLILALYFLMVPLAWALLFLIISGFVGPCLYHTPKTSQPILIPPTQTYQEFESINN